MSCRAALALLLGLVGAGEASTIRVRFLPSPSPGVDTYAVYRCAGVAPVACVPANPSLAEWIEQALCPADTACPPLAPECTCDLDEPLPPAGTVQALSYLLTARAPGVPQSPPSGVGTLFLAGPTTSSTSTSTTTTSSSTAPVVTTTSTTLALPPLPSTLCQGTGTVILDLGGLTPGYIRGSPFSVNASTDTDTLWTVLRPGGQPLRAVLYTGAGTLAAVSYEVRPKGTALAWVAFPLVVPMRLPAGTYWLGLWAGPIDAGAAGAAFGTTAGARERLPAIPYSATALPPATVAFTGTNQGAAVLGGLGCAPPPTTTTTTLAPPGPPTLEVVPAQVARQ